MLNKSICEGNITKFFLSKITSFNLRKLRKLFFVILLLPYYSLPLISFNISFISLSVFSFIPFYIKFSFRFFIILLRCLPLLFSFSWCFFTHPFLSFSFLSFFSFFTILLYFSLLSFSFMNFISLMRKKMQKKEIRYLNDIYNNTYICYIYIYEHIYNNNYLVCSFLNKT